MRARFGDFLPLVALALQLAVCPFALANSSTNTGPLNYAREEFTTILLSNGNVLAIGGANYSGGPHNGHPDPELYSPATGLWSVIPMSVPREHLGFTTTVLMSGKVLVTGGTRADGGGTNYMLAGAELFDPAIGTWTNTAAMNIARCLHSATLLPNGKVLVAGGYNATTLAFHSTTELYDPASGSWTTNGSLITPRGLHTATLLTNGKVLVAGGFTTNGIDIPSAELYDPGTGTATPISFSTAIKQPSGAFTIGLTNAAGAALTTLAATNPALPISDWAVLGPMSESPSGSFHFTDDQAKTNSKRFYRVRSP